MIKRTFLTIALLWTAGASMAQVVVAVNNRVVLDNRTMPAGAITTQAKARDTKATNTTITSDNSVNDIASAESNKTVSHYFEVGKSDMPISNTWLDALRGCRDYNSGDNATNGNWRLPTQRELMLIWVSKETIHMKNVSGFSPFAGTNYSYWIATENGIYNAWILTSTGRAILYNKGSNLFKYRCIRDLKP